MSCHSVKLIISAFSIFLFHSQFVYAVEASAYQASMQKYIQESSQGKSPFSDEDLRVMQKAAEDLARSLPEPGLQVGEKAPNFSLENAFGHKVSLQQALDKGPVVLVFYRGAWCPFCNMHLRAIHQHLPDMQKEGAQLILVTPQTPDKSAEQLKKDGYNFEVLSDLDSRVMKDYRLYFELPDDLIKVYKKHGLDIEAFNGKGRNVLPVAGSFVIDQKGIVRAMHAETDYKQRMEPADMIRVLQSL